MANADTPRDAARARGYGAKGIGLCRTERMFNDPQRLPIVQEMILADTPDERRAALAKLLPIQRADFKGIFTAMAGLPVTVRLLDPPMHEFLPTASQLEFEIGQLRNLQRTARSVAELPDTLKLLDPGAAARLRREPRQAAGEPRAVPRGKRGDAALERREAMLKKVHLLAEVNPMLGHRGVRLGLTFPEIYEMQIRAILEAAAQCTQGRHRRASGDHGAAGLHGRGAEARQGDGRRAAAGDRGARRRAARLPVRHDGRSRPRLHARGRSRAESPNSSRSAPTTSRRRRSRSRARTPRTSSCRSTSNPAILPDNPFEMLDVDGVGRLMQLAVEWGRGARPDLVVGICGEHGGQPEAIRFCHDAGLDYVSCSAPRVPIARLAAAQAALQSGSVSAGSGLARANWT